jgi:hypothetical protein
VSIIMLGIAIGTTVIIIVLTFQSLIMLGLAIRTTVIIIFLTFKSVPLDSLIFFTCYRILSHLSAIFLFSDESLTPSDRK